MSDIDCGDLDCDCNCDCDCNPCEDCSCNCFDTCCLGDNNNDSNTNIVLWICCCFPSSDNTDPPNRTRHHTDNSVCCCCCCTSPRRRTNKANTSSLKHKRKGWCWGLFSKPSSPTRNRTETDNKAAPMDSDSKQDGRYPLDESHMEHPPWEYSERNPRRARFEELSYPPRERRMDGKWSKPMHYGDFDKRDRL